MIIRSLLAAIAISALLASPGVAVPWKFQINTDADPRFAPFELRGARLRINGSWDPAGLTPLNANATSTLWPTTNTTISLTVTGSRALDGVYSGAVYPGFQAPWYLTNIEGQNRDSIRFPRMTFPIGTSGTTLVDTFLIANVPEEFFSTTGLLYPRNFSNEQVVWEVKLGGVTNISGFASFVPEPSSATLATVGVASLAALRRRK